MANQITKEEKEFMNALFKECGLNTADHLFNHHHYKIIKRTGIEKIQARKQIDVFFEPLVTEKHFATVKATAKMGDKTIQTFGSALYGLGETKEVDGKQKWFQTGTTQTLYVLEVAEKRALSRAVLKITGMYAYNFFGEDEEFEKPPKEIGKGDALTKAAEEKLNPK